MQTCLVTGGAGFIGSNFVLHMLREHGDVRIVNVDALTYAGNLENLADVADDPRYEFVRVDIRDRGAVDELFARFSPTLVVNFAAESHVDRSIADPGVFADTNVMGTVTLLNAARSAWEGPDGSYPDAVRYLQVSTDEVYGTLAIPDEVNPDGSPAHPDAVEYFREGTPLSPHSPYSASKASADLFVRAYHDTFGFPAIVTRCSNNYGPRQFPEKLIPLMVNNCLHHEPLPLYGDGLNVRDWLYVEDHCRAIDAVLAGGHAGEVYNVGGHNERSNAYIVRCVIDLVAEMTGDDAVGEGLIEHVADRPGHDRRYGISPDKIWEQLGWRPETRFEDGIRKTVRWYLDNPEWVRHVTSGSYQDYYRRMYGDRR